MKESTKEKIKASAAELFANYGHAGTSIREIAKLAGVNLAAVNYHFKNKENLYCEVFALGFHQLEEKIMKLDGKFSSSPDLAVAMYELFTSKENGSALLNTFRIILNNDINIPEHFNLNPEQFGPPGQMALRKIIIQESDIDLPERGILWATNMIFINVVHSSLLMNSSMIKDLCDKSGLYSDSVKKQNIKHHVQAIINYLIQNKVEF